MVEEEKERCDKSGQERNDWVCGSWVNLDETTVESVTGPTGGRPAIASGLWQLLASGDHGFNLLCYLM